MMADQEKNKELRIVLFTVCPQPHCLLPTGRIKLALMIFSKEFALQIIGLIKGKSSESGSTKLPSKTDYIFTQTAR